MKRTTERTASGTPRSVLSRRSKLSINTREVPYPKLPASPSFAHSPSRDDLWSPSSTTHRKQTALNSFLNDQRLFKMQTMRVAVAQEHEHDIATIAQWRSDLANAKVTEARTRAQRQTQRLQMQQDSANEYLHRALLAEKEKNDDIVLMQKLRKTAWEEDRRAEEQKLAYRRMLQEMMEESEQQRKRAIARHKTELREDIEMQKALALRLAQQETARELEIKSRVLKQHRMLLGEKDSGMGATDRISKKQEQEMYRKVLDRQVQEHRERDWKAWELRKFIL